MFTIFKIKKKSTVRKYRAIKMKLLQILCTYLTNKFPKNYIQKTNQMIY